MTMVMTISIMTVVVKTLIVYDSYSNDRIDHGSSGKDYNVMTDTVITITVITSLPLLP